MSEEEILKQEVERYILGEMDEKSRRDFEKRMETDDKIRKEVEIQRLIISSVRKEKLKNIISEEEEALKRKRVKVRRIRISTVSLLAAASLIGFIYVGNLQQCQEIASPYYSSYPNIYELPSRGEENLVPTDIDSLFFNALKLLEANKNRKAVHQLESVNENKLEFKAGGEDVLNWYLALGYLKTGKKNKARTMLKKVIDDAESDFNDAATKLLNQLNE